LSFLEEKIITITQNPYKELLKVSSRTHISVDDLDFNLLSFSTKYRFSQQEWQKISEKDLSFFDEDSNFLKEDLQVEQNYKIEIFAQQNKRPKALKLIVNKDLTEVIAELDFSLLNYHEKLAFELLQNIYKQMLKLNLFIGIRIFNFKQELIKILNEHKKNPLKNLVKIKVAQGVKPTKSQDENLILLYKEKTKNYTLDEKRSGIISVNENEVVLRHTKLKKGSQGRGLNLVMLEIVEPKKNDMKFSCSTAFKIVENEDFVDYVALKKGFIVENAGSFDIANELDFNGVDFKNIGIIKAGIDSGVKINIRLISDMQDAVGSGVGIECEELNIAGNVSSNTHLNASKLKIEGTAQSKSKIYGKKASIKTLRGFVCADYVDIDLLENGRVKAKVVKIKKSLGGVIEAEQIYIENLMHNNSCTFYKNALIEKFEGKNNKFQAKVQITDKDYQKEILQLNEVLTHLSKKIHTLKQNIHTNTNNVSLIEKQIKQMQEIKAKIPEQYLKITKDFKQLKQELTKFQNEEKVLLEKRALLNKELKILQDVLLGATFINKSGVWSDMSEIKFTLLSPYKELFYSSDKNEKFKLLALKRQIYNNEETIILEKKLDYDEKDIQWLSQYKDL